MIHFDNTDITYDRNSNIELVEDKVHTGRDVDYTIDSINRLIKAEEESNLRESYSIFVEVHGEKELRNCIQALIDLYTVWNTAEPGKGYDTQASEWKMSLEASQAGRTHRATHTATQPQPERSQ